MNKKKNFFNKIHFFSKTIKAFVKLITQKKYSDADLFGNIYFFIDNLLNSILFFSLKFMIKGRRTVLTFFDLKNSISEVFNPNFILPRTISYKKPRKNLNFLTKIFRPKIKKIYGKKKKFKTKFPLIFQSWITIPTRRKNQIDMLKKNVLCRKNSKPKKFFLISLSFSLLSNKQKIFFRYLVSKIEKGTKGEQNICLESLAEDFGLFPIIPYIILFLNRFVLKQVNCVSDLKIVLEVIQSLLLNQSFRMEPFIHQILPILIHCVIGNFFFDSSQDIISFRFFSANIIGYIFHRFGHRHISLYSRITFAFVKCVLNSIENVSAIHGALIGLSVFGNKTIELLVIPYISIVIEKIEINLKKRTTDLIEKSNTKKLHDFLINLLTLYLVGKNIQYKYQDFSSFLDGNQIEKIYKIFPKLRNLKKINKFF